jgi:hypothetical protein
MDNIAALLSASQMPTRQAIAMETVKMALQSEQQMAALLAQSAQAGQTAYANPAHLGQSLDTYA